MNIIIDLIVVAIILLCIFLSARKGFVKTFVEVVGFVIAILITFTISTPLADATYDKIIEPPVIKAVGEAIESSGELAEDDAINALPDFVVNNAEKLNISLEEFQNKLTENLSSGAETAVKTASQDVVKPIVSEILGLIYSIVIMLVLLIVVKILARIINKMFSFSIIGTANKVLGGVIGIPKAMIFTVLFCMIISLIVALYGGFLFFTPENIEDTVVFKYFAETALNISI